MIRAFIAIILPAALCQAFEEIRAACQELAVAFRWIQPERIHLTVKFLGNVSPEDIPRVARAMECAVADQTAFTLSIRSLGCFPNPSYPRVLWMGVDDADHELTRLHQCLEDTLVPLGFPPERRPFRPHLTLARVPQRVGRNWLLPFLHTYHDRQFGQLTVDHIHLFQSQLHRTGPVYTILRSVPLQH